MISQIKKQLKKDWSLTAEALEELLASLDDEQEKASLIYEDIRKRLVRQFRVNQSVVPEDLADEVFNRIARKISQENFILDRQNPYPYFHQTARYVLLEHQRQNRRRILGLDDLTAEDEPAYDPLEILKRAEERLHDELGLNAIRECRKTLSAAEIELFDNYTAAVGKNKKQLHEQLAVERGKTRHSLKVVVSRLRKKLIECAKKKLAIVLN